MQVLGNSDDGGDSLPHSSSSVPIISNSDNFLQASDSCGSLFHETLTSDDDSNSRKSPWILEWFLSFLAAAQKPLQCCWNEFVLVEQGISSSSSSAASWTLSSLFLRFFASEENSFPSGTLFLLHTPSTPQWVRMNGGWEAEKQSSNSTQWCLVLAWRLEQSYHVLCLFFTVCYVHCVCFFPFC